MLLNADLSRPVIVTPDDYLWISSPQAGVDRMMLDRAGGELARATSIVRYAPNSTFPRHLHPGGEEIFVIAGTFSDGGADHPAGWYLRNPPGSSHEPFSHEGALILVKLCQMPETETRNVRVNTRDPARWTHAAGRAICPLFAAGTERVSIQRLLPGAPVVTDGALGAELLILAGTVEHQGRVLDSGTWIRVPAAAPSDLTAGAAGVTVYLKTGHLCGAACGGRP